MNNFHIVFLVLVSGTVLTDLSMIPLQYACVCPCLCVCVCPPASSLSVQKILFKLSLTLLA